MVVNKKILISSDKAVSNFTVYVLSAYIISLKYNALRQLLEETCYNITLFTANNVYCAWCYSVAHIPMTSLYDMTPG
ncbi:hypothetical protein E0528_22545 [Salmonella enterica subsp. enterica serovar Typhimurium]|nr:hypothetical protein [Salmonella enterica subsp. enterica serovar Typhimurium]